MSEYKDPRYFDMNIDEALSICATQITINIASLAASAQSDFISHQVLDIAQILQFLGALVAAQRKDHADLVASLAKDNASMLEQIQILQRLSSHAALYDQFEVQGQEVAGLEQRIVQLETKLRVIENSH